MRRDGRVADEGHFAARREETNLDVVVRRFGREDVRDLRAAELASDPAHLVALQHLGIEHDRGRIAAEAVAGEGIDEKQAALALRLHSGAVSMGTEMRISPQRVRPVNIFGSIGGGLHGYTRAHPGVA